MAQERDLALWTRPFWVGRSLGFGDRGLCGVGGVLNARRNASSRRRAVSSALYSSLLFAIGVSR